MTNDTAARLRTQEERVAAIQSPEEFQALIEDKGIDIEDLTRAIRGRCTNLYAALSGQAKGWQKAHLVAVPRVAFMTMVEQWIDGFALGVMMEHNEGDPVEPVLDYAAIGETMRDADSLSEEHGITLRQMGYDLMHLTVRLGNRVPPQSRPILGAAGVPQFAPGLDGLSMGVCAIRKRRDGHIFPIREA